MLKEAKEQEVVKLYDEHLLLKDLMDDTFRIIKRANNIDPIKILIEIHDVLSINSNILHKFREADLTFDEVWLDPATLKHLNYLRCKLMVYYHNDFISIEELRTYNRSFCQFFNFVLLRLKNGFDFNMAKIS